MSRHSIISFMQENGISTGLEVFSYQDVIEIEITEAGLSLSYELDRAKILKLRDSLSMILGAGKNGAL